MAHTHRLAVLPQIFVAAVLLVAMLAIGFQVGRITAPDPAPVTASRLEPRELTPLPEWKVQLHEAMNELLTERAEP